LSRRPSLKDLLCYVDRAQTELLEVKASLPELHRRGEHLAQDGFPAGGDNGGGGSDISDPTSAAAMARPMSDAIGKAIWDMETLIVEVDKRMRVIRNLRTYACSVAAEERGRQSTIPNCVNPACARSLHDQGPNGRGTAGRCDNCYEYRRTHEGQDRPPSLVEQEQSRHERKQVVDA
jgi:hypothetical protein